MPLPRTAQDISAERGWSTSLLARSQHWYGSKSWKLKGSPLPQSGLRPWPQLRQLVATDSCCNTSLQVSLTHSWPLQWAWTRSQRSDSRPLGQNQTSAFSARIFSQTKLYKRCSLLYCLVGESDSKRPMGIQRSHTKSHSVIQHQLCQQLRKWTEWRSGHPTRFQTPYQLCPVDCHQCAHDQQTYYIYISYTNILYVSLHISKGSLDLLRKQLTAQRKEDVEQHLFEQSRHFSLRQMIHFCKFHAYKVQHFCTSTHQFQPSSDLRQFGKFVLCAQISELEEQASERMSSTKAAVMIAFHFFTWTSI